MYLSMITDMWSLHTRTTCLVSLLLFAMAMGMCSLQVKPGTTFGVVDIDVGSSIPPCSPHETNGVFVNYTFVGWSGCALQFLRYPHLALGTLVGTHRVWIHFIGDSDTRGLVLGMLRLIHSPLSNAVTLEDFAEAYGCTLEPELLLMRQARCGGVVHDLTQISRLGYIDYQFAYTPEEFVCLKRLGRSTMWRSRSQPNTTWYSKDRMYMLHNVSDYDTKAGSVSLPQNEPPVCG